MGVLPLLVLLCWAVLRLPLTVDLRSFEAAVLVLSTLVATAVVRRARSTYLEGVLLLGAYCIVAISYLFRSREEVRDVATRALVSLTRTERRRFPLRAGQPASTQRLSLGLRTSWRSWPARGRSSAASATARAARARVHRTGGRRTEETERAEVSCVDCGDYSPLSPFITRPSRFDLSVSGRPPAASEGGGPPNLKTKT